MRVDAYSLEIGTVDILQYVAVEMLWKGCLIAPYNDSAVVDSAPADRTGTNSIDLKFGATARIIHQTERLVSLTPANNLALIVYPEPFNKNGLVIGSVAKVQYLD